MSGTFPTDPGPATVVLDSKQPAIVSRSVSGKRQARISGGHLWAAEFTWSRTPRALLAPIYAFVNAQKGGFGSFNIVLPNYATPNGSGSGSPIAGSASVGATSISSSGWSGVGDYLKQGDVLKFSSHDKVYMATKDVNSGSTSIEFVPPLIAAVSGGSITVNDVPFTMSLDGDVVRWKGSAPNLATVSLRMTEAL